VVNSIVKRITSSLETVNFKIFLKSLLQKSQVSKDRKHLKDRIDQKDRKREKSKCRQEKGRN
jgi:hypothetical protein